MPGKRFAQLVAPGLSDSHVDRISIGRQLVRFVEHNQVVAVPGKPGLPKSEKCLL